MTPTDEIRAKLDELGVEYDTYDLPNGEHGVSWIDGNNIEWEAVQQGENLEIHALQLVTPEQAIAATVGPKITEDTSDGWHTFKELYHHRALLFSVIVHNYRDMCWKSKKHDDGTELDWNFIVGIDTPWGQASYHYGMDYWDMFDCKVLERAPKYDGYTPEQSVERIAKLVELDAATVSVTEDETDARALTEAIRDDDGVRYSMDEVMDIMGKDVAATVGKDIEHYDGSGRRGTVAILQGGRKPEEVMFVGEDGGVTHYLPEGTCRKEDDYTCENVSGSWWEFKCSRCGYEVDESPDYLYNSCPCCGSTIVEEEAE